MAEQTDQTRELVLSLANSTKTLGRREIALAIARGRPRWLHEVAVSAANAPLLRDVAMFAEEQVAQAVISRLLSNASRRLRWYGHQAVADRERHQRAMQALELFRNETSPSRRLWWLQSFVALAEEKAIAQLDQLELPGDDLSHEFAAIDMRDDARKRLEKDARDEDRAIEQDAAPWVW